MLSIFIYKIQTYASHDLNADNKEQIPSHTLLLVSFPQIICLPYPICHRVPYLHILLQPRSRSDIPQNI